VREKRDDRKPVPATVEALGELPVGSKASRAAARRTLEARTENQRVTVIEYSTEEEKEEKLSKIPHTARTAILCSPRRLTREEWDAKYSERTRYLARTSRDPNR
jgi:hypothetical protein